MLFLQGGYTNTNFLGLKEAVLRRIVWAIIIGPGLPPKNNKQQALAQKPNINIPYTKVRIPECASFRKCFG